jgi:uncharacterized protein YjbJ (UPF0337 family)
MGDKMDETKGRTKEAVGDLTDDDRLKREGKMDQAGASVKEKAREGKEAIENGVDTVKEKIGQATDDDR